MRSTHYFFNEAQRPKTQFYDTYIICIDNQNLVSIKNSTNYCFGFLNFSVTCQRQPALGCVYKLVEINEKPKIKLSQDVEKVTMPGKKTAFRLYR